MIDYVHLLPFMHIPRIACPPEGKTAAGWCLYENDRWDGPAPQEWDDDGWFVYADRATALRALAKELRNRCDRFDAGLLQGEELNPIWYPEKVTYLSNGWVVDETGAEFKPGWPW